VIPERRRRCGSISTRAPVRGEHFRRELEIGSFVRRRRHAGTGGADEIETQLVEQLRALGYVE
jgi:hypothetical protein